MALNDALFDLLDSSVEELADLEKFTPVPAGTHVMDLSWERKDINGHATVVAKFAVVETLEMANANEEVPEPGKKCDIAFMLTKTDKETKETVPNTIGQGQLKEIIRELQATFGGESIAAVMENSEGSRVAVTLKVRKSKDDPDVAYNSIKALIVNA